MAIKPTNIYTAKVAYVTEFDTNVSLMLVLKTRNGKAIKDIFVSKSWPLSNEIAGNLNQGDEVVIKAEGYSKNPVKFLDAKNNTKPVHALIGLDKKSLSTILPTEIATGEDETDEKKLKQSEGLVTRAREAMAAIFRIAAGV